METVSDVRNEMIALFGQIKRREIPNAQARTLLGAAKIVLDSVKVEIAATALGKAIGEVTLNGRPAPVTIEGSLTGCE